ADRQLQSAAHAVALYGGDGRLGRAREGLEGSIVESIVFGRLLGRAGRLELRDVRPGRECPGAGARQDHGAGVAILFGFPDPAPQGRPHRRGERIEACWIVYDQPPDAAPIIYPELGPFHVVYHLVLPLAIAMPRCFSRGWRAGANLGPWSVRLGRKAPPAQLEH